MNQTRFSLVLLLGILLFMVLGCAIHLTKFEHPYVLPSTFYLQAFALGGGLVAMWLVPQRFLLRIFGPSGPSRNPQTAIGILAAITFLFLLFVNRNIIHQFQNSADEFSCDFLAQCLLRGKLWAAPHPLSQFFETTHVGNLGGKWFSVYPPGWPLILAVATKLNLKHAINPLMTTLSLTVLTLWSEKIYGRKVALIAAIPLVASAFFLLTGAAYYSHNTSMFFMSLFFYCSWLWIEKGSVKAALAAGLSLGYAFFTRYLTAAAMAFPVLIYIAWKFRKHLFTGDSGVWLFGGSLFLLIALHSGYNFLITGDFFDPPNHYLHSHERLGFISGYTPLTALHYFVRRWLYLLDWTPPLVVVLFVIGLFLKPLGTWDLLLRLSALFLGLSYIFYYSWGGNQYGPRYFWEAYPIIGLIAVRAGLELWNQPVLFYKKAALGLFAFSLIGNAWILKRHFSFYGIATSERKAVYNTAETETERPAVVFLSGYLGDKLVLSPEDSVRNTSPWLDHSLVFAKDRGDENRLLVPYFPGRSYYRASYDRAALKSKIERIYF